LPVAKRNLPLNALRAFEAVGRHLHMRRAAEELCVSHSAVSQQIRKLEIFLEVQLFERTNKGLRLTPAGEHMLQEVSSSLDRIVKAAYSIDSHSNRGPITIASVPGFAANWLVPFMGDFLKNFPNFHISVLPLGVVKPEIPTAAELAICYGKPAVREERVTKLVDPVIFPVCSPTIFQHTKAIRKAKDICKYTLLHHDDGETWAQWLEVAGIRSRSETGDLYLLGGGHLVINAARAGLGIALADNTEVASDIRDGRLVKLFDITIPGDSSYYLVTVEEKFRTAAGMLFEEWLKQRIITGRRGPVSFGFQY
jgi:LysR family transcriptional regulator, glycine cleavage system transcriptional activator